MVRAAWTNADGRSERRWGALGEMGVLGALVPEPAGGLGLTVLDVVLIAEETGWAALPEPFVEHVLVGAPIVATAAVADGSLTIAAGDPFLPYAVLVEDDGRLLLGARRPLVARSRRLARPHPSVDRGRRLGRVPRGVDPTARPRRAPRRSTGARSAPPRSCSASRPRCSTPPSSTSVERRQFGVPIGSYQAIKHKLADVRVALEFARPLVYRAAYSLAQDDPDAAVHVSMAKARAGDVAALAARHALQCHGAIGYSFEYDLHLWMKRAWALECRLG